MADSKISALPASTTPLAGTEVLPIVQGGTTKQVSVASLTDARQSVAINPVSASTMNNVAIGGTTPLAGAFTTLTSTNNATFNGIKVGRNGGNYLSSIAIGSLALVGNSQEGNTAVGDNAAYQSTGVGISAFGAGVLQNNTTGAINSVFGGAAAGAYNAAMFSNTTGNSNAAFGSGALTTNSTGSSNAAFGIISLYSATGDQNTAIGFQAGSTATTGSNNGFFGYAAQPSSATVSNEYTYGNSAVTKHRFVGGDIVIGTAGKGIDFSADGQATGMTSELLDDYEEGTWTPTYVGWVIDPTTNFASYTKTGRTVTINMLCSPGIAGGSSITGLPFVSGLQGAVASIRGINNDTVGPSMGAITNASTTIDNIAFFDSTGYFWALSVTYTV